MFLANLFAGAGRWAVAGDYVADAREIARGLDDPAQRQHLMAEALEFAYRTGSVHTMRRELRIADTELRRAADQRSLTPTHEARVCEFRALVAAQLGDRADAERWFSRAEQHYLRSGARDPKYVRMLARRARFLHEWNRHALELRVARRALEYAQREAIDERVPEAALALARAALDRGELRDAGEALARFERSHVAAVASNDRMWLEYDALRQRFFAGIGNPAAATAALQSGLGRIEAGWATATSAEAQLQLAGHRELRDIMHEQLLNDARLGYEFERAWRRAGTGRRNRDAPGLAAWASITRHPSTAWPATGSEVSPPPDDSTLQILYFWGSEVVRWTRTRHGLHRSVLSLAPSEIERRVEAARAGLTHSHRLSDARLAHLASDLRDLARLLLPPEARASGTNAPRFRTLEILSDGALARLPFEALNLSNRDYRPLLAELDVVYARGTAVRRERAASGTGVIVVDPEPSPTLKQRYGLPSLPLSHSEARLLRALAPSSVLLANSGATRAAVLERWEDAPWLYFSGHVVVDPDSPFMSFIPLAAESTHDGAAKPYLEPGDVLTADLSACELVVLSGCASGVSGEPGAGGAGLARSFLDAGAHAVVLTYWPVKDDEAATLMRAFIHAWRRAGQTPDQALHTARRACMGSRSALATASMWSAWAIEFARPAAEQTGGSVALR
jgi:CHAT domain-containing protein